ncbi:hypothetical protein QN382_19030 [Pseudomonas sp. 10B1]|uniref:hypothetical protein n=1 Tax=unclassified Pseudomonas TaxID=196821 RepID=UPI002B23788F|nr:MULTISPECIES: hypothetical protein [unclassified Pseudomonas]MEA9994286.1 hypothetical protein [Pseudomonas sp. AA4]MEB0088537.1 hypothetical protein [Pseudomonas sp. RTI1]MEB0126540.1 hypothetical protein [Pseudomonas sp. CCC1.2]MEB0154647.1 hypothetical protein [Pseudomonas sp. CCC4.3]MEB0221136.1 hypothetical protein [Pseudomonas sp. AB12(2023)]
MTRRNGPVGQRLIDLFNALQIRETTFVQVAALSSACGIDPRRVLADHFQRGAIHA